MKSFLSILVLIFKCVLLSAQSNDIWTSFESEKDSLIGYKDIEGNVRIKPMFSSTFSAPGFVYIAAVSEENNGTEISYYLTKNGKIVGRDSLFISDNMADCESEGFIRFHDPKTDKVGMFNKNGQIAIPARYNHLSQILNGTVYAISGAEKRCEDKSCEHYTWAGGNESLLDSAGNILIDNFKLTSEINLFSLRKSILPDPDPFRINFKGGDNYFYSFIDFRKEFNYWLHKCLIDSLSYDKLYNACFEDVVYWKKKHGYVSQQKSKYLKGHYKSIKTSLLHSRTADFQNVFIDGLNHYIFNSERFKLYYNNCNESKEYQYPVLLYQVTNMKEKGEGREDLYSFLRTENGYKLISVELFEK